MKVIPDTNVPIKAWIDGVLFEEEAERQLRNVANLPCVGPHVAVMPDVHFGIGATVGSVIPTERAIIPAAVGVDLGCGMTAVKTNLRASDLPDNLFALRTAIEAAVPHGRSDNGGRGDVGAWRGELPISVLHEWLGLKKRYDELVVMYPKIETDRAPGQLGTLGTGNHFIELCLDENQDVWVMLHSGSRGVGNRIGSFFIEKAKKEMERWFIQLPDKDLAYLPEGSEHFTGYMTAVKWAQDYAKSNRDVMMSHTLSAIEKTLGRLIVSDHEVVSCHHNYVSRERHRGRNLWITRKGAVSAQEGELGIIPGSMGAKSFIVRGRGNPESFCSCSHGAGRKMSRTQARKSISLTEHVEATKGVECRKDESVLDETPAAYKDIDLVMAAQADLVDVVHVLKQVLCVKG